MMARLARRVALLVVGCALLTACGDDPPETGEARRSDVVRATTEAATPDSDATTATASPATETTQPEPSETDGPTESTATEDPAEASEEEASRLTDWRNTTYRMRAYAGSDLEDLTFTDGVANTTVIVAVEVDPTDPHRVAMWSTSADSEGYPLFVNAGIFRMDHASGVALPEAEVSSMTGDALMVHLCTTGTEWGGGDELVLHYGDCDLGDPGSLRWTRDGASLAFHESDGTGSSGAGSGSDAGGSAGSGTLDVSSYGEVHFSSPSGAIECTMNGANGGWAACQFPPEMDRAGLPGDNHCEHISLAGVGVGREVGWICSGGAFALAEVSTPFTSWFDDTGWEPAVTEWGSSTAAVPYGSTLVLDQLRCRSAEDGMHCSHSGSGAGFSVARAGVQRSGPLTDRFTQLWD